MEPNFSTLSSSDSLCICVYIVPWITIVHRICHLHKDLLRPMVWGLRNTHGVTVYEQNWSPTQPCTSSCKWHLTEVIPKNSFSSSPSSTWSPRHASRPGPELVFWIIFTPCLRFTGSSSGQWCGRFTSLSHTVTNLNSDTFKKLLKPHSQVHNEQSTGSLLCDHSFIHTALPRLSNRQ